MSKAELNEVLAETEAGEVWGVGRRIAQQLAEGPVNLLQPVLYVGFGPSTAGNTRPFGMPP